MLKRSKSAIAGMVVAALMSAVSIATVSPANAGGNNWRHGNWNRGNWNHGGWNYSNNYWVGPAIGLGAGLVFGAILAQPRYYAPGYAPQYGNRHVGGNAPVYDAQCLDARARHGENSAEAMTFC